MAFHNCDSSKTINCCKDCKNRKINCHSTCETYLAQKKQWSEDKRKIKESLPASLKQSDFDKICWDRSKTWTRANGKSRKRNKRVDTY